MIDLLEIQKMIFERMSQLEYTIIDEFSNYQEARMPYIELSSLYINENNTKNTDGIVVDQYVNAYSAYKGKKEILEMIQKISNIMKFRTDNLYVEQLTTTIKMDSDVKGTIFSDDTGNDYYHAVLIFKIFVYDNNSNNNE
jgi:hypothetical protein